MRYPLKGYSIESMDNSGANDFAAVVGMAFVMVVMLGFFALYVYSAVWAYGDAEARGKPGCLVALLVLFFSWPLGLIFWVVFRPEPTWRR